MKYVFLSIVFFIIGCSSPGSQSQQKKVNALDPSRSMRFEGKEYYKVDLETYQRETDDYQTILTLYPNGKVKSVEHQGDFQSCGALVDTSRYFNANGVLIKQVYHHHWMPEGASGCHESIQDLHVTEYSDDGSIKAKKVFRMAYEGEEYKAGRWQEFDEHGKVISTINYGDPYSADDVLKIEFIEKLEANVGKPYNQSILARKGFIPVYKKSHENGVLEFYNATHDSRIVLSRYVHPDGESMFKVKYYVSRNQLVAFEEALKEGGRTYVYHGSSTDAYLKAGLGTYRSKKVKLNVEEGMIIYTHVEGKELQPAPINFDQIEIRAL